MSVRINILSGRRHLHICYISIINIILFSELHNDESRCFPGLAGAAVPPPARRWKAASHRLRPLSPPIDTRLQRDGAFGLSATGQSLRVKLSKTPLEFEKLMRHRVVGCFVHIPPCGPRQAVRLFHSFTACLDLHWSKIKILYHDIKTRVFTKSLNVLL